MVVGTSSVAYGVSPLIRGIKSVCSDTSTKGILDGWNDVSSMTGATIRSNAFGTTTCNNVAGVTDGRIGNYHLSLD